MEESRKTISQKMAEIKDEISSLTVEIDRKKAERDRLQIEWNKCKKSLDASFDTLFNFYESKLVGEDNFKTGNEIASLFPKTIRDIYGTNMLVKKITDAAEKAGYHRHITYVCKQRSYAFIKTKEE